MLEENQYFSALISQYFKGYDELNKMKEGVDRMEEDVKKLFFTPMKVAIQDAAAKVSGTPCLEITFKYGEGDLTSTYRLFLDDEENIIWIRETGHDVFMAHKRVHNDTLIRLAREVAEMRFSVDQCTDDEMERLYGE